MNIFSDINRLTNEDIRMQIALFEQISLGNALKESGNRLMGGIAEVATALVSSLWKNTTFEYEVTKMTDMISLAYKDLEGKSRDELIQLLTKQLVQKCGIAEAEKENISEERLSYLIINEASRMYNVKKNQTPANKLDCICIEYNKAFLQALHNVLVKQDAKAVKATDMMLQKRLNEVSIEEKRELHKNLMPKEFTGAGIGRIIRLERGTKNLEYVVNCLGKDIFDTVQVYITATFSAMKGLNRISRSLLAQFIYSLKYKSGFKYAVDERILPSYVPASEKKAQDEIERNFREHISNRMIIEDSIAQNIKILDKAVQEIENTKEKLESIEKEYEEIELRFEKLERQKDRYISKDTTDEAKKYFEEINSTKRSLDEVFDFKERHRNKIEELTQQQQAKEMENEKLRQELEAVKKETQDEVTKLSLKIMIGWKAFFYRFTFEDELFEKLALNFMSAERIRIEEVLKEVHELKDFSAYDASPGVVCCVTENNKNISIKIDNGHISEIDYV